LTPGAEMFARYAYAPNALGYCGPPLGATLRDGSVDEVRSAAARFSGAWPYLQVLSRLTGIAAEEATGKYVYDVLPFRDEDRRDWWMCVDPYNGLATRSRHPERSLLLGDDAELLVSVGYVRDTRSGPVRRLVITLRGAQQRAVGAAAIRSDAARNRHCGRAQDAGARRSLSGTTERDTRMGG